MKELEYVGVRMPPELVKMVRDTADREDRTLSSVVRIALTEWFNQRAKEEPINGKYATMGK